MRSSRRSIEVELFPFLSVLVCVIGSLILLIVVVTAQISTNQRQVTIVARENGQNQAKTPRYIECRSDGIVIYPEQTFVNREDINRSNSALQSLLAEVSFNRDKEYLIVAIRPDGIDVFQEVRTLVERQNIDIGFEPIDEGWQLKVQDAATKRIK
ncbi:hypothetical protein [Chroogloeocystis siderophila]|jgi:biopolymer transport protein ExbD|uniref:Uncharacterized protein n=1 Tax=Chroogloeocystis siderophila 5.2 s.c.1 TaxID=247279 RepID=A0A1U7HRY4_9CHRO|nr:hypothetical protein [Chroogloeocystis siderophila]OKH26342.1 hypothetical protein NIES1031_11275 [Chroogloeocystis siderophila 5.2 s.c.1]